MLCLFLVHLYSCCFSENQPIADSLAKVLEFLDIESSDYLYTLNQLCNNETNKDKLLEYARDLINTAKRLDEPAYEIKGYMLAGQAQLRLSNYEKSLNYLLIGLKLAEQQELSKEIGQFQSTIADIYAESGNFTAAYQYYDKAIVQLIETGDSISIATLYLNYGDALYSDGQLTRASENFRYSNEIFYRLGITEGIAFSLGNLGMVYASQGKHKLAERNLNQSISMFEEMGNYYPISVFLTFIADIYLEKRDKLKSLNYAKRSLSLAELYGLKDEISHAHFKLHEIHSLFGSSSDALFHYKAHITMRDSINDIETVEALANQRTEYEVSQKQAELDLVDQKRKTNSVIAMGTGVGAGLFSLVALLLYRNNRFTKKTNKIIAEQKEKSDKLLLNILPKETAEELKTNGRVKAKRHDSVSVLFADFVGFTKYSRDMEPEVVVETIDRYFRVFDDIVVDLGLEKIKTLGDGYMCAGGLPKASTDHALRLVQAAHKMNDYVKETATDTSTTDSFGIRIGIHSGPVVSGVVGSKKFAYDIWGDTVNTAARLETHSKPGHINVSQETYDLIKDKFTCTPREAQDVIGKGMMDMYFVEEFKNLSAGT